MSSTLFLSVKGEDGSVKASSSDHEQVSLVYSNSYVDGDTIVLNSTEQDVYLVVQLEDSMSSELVYLSGTEYIYMIPHEEKRTSYSPKSFIGNLHVITARLATSEEIHGYRNLARNSYDQHSNSTLFPHASANVETRGEAVFAARNAINGNTVNYSHGYWPFESWGINQQKDAEITVHFGRIVEIDKVVLTLRADFPHDNYWTSVKLSCSDGSEKLVELIKTHKGQTVCLEPKKVEWVKLSELIQSDDPSPFPALTQIEVFGRECL